jgi:hypothetical protein
LCVGAYFLFKNQSASGSDGFSSGSSQGGWTAGGDYTAASQNPSVQELQQFSPQQSSQPVTIVRSSSQSGGSRYTPGVTTTAGVQAPAVPSVTQSTTNRSILFTGFQTPTGNVVTGSVNTATGQGRGFVPMDPAQGLLNRLGLAAR